MVAAHSFASHTGNEVTWQGNEVEVLSPTMVTMVTVWRNHLWPEGMGKGDEKRRRRKLEERKPRIMILVDLGVVYRV